MKINKLVVTFFIVIGLLTEIRSAENHECYMDDKERIRNIESQISSLQIEMNQIKEHQSLGINRHASNIEMETDNNSILLYMNKQDTEPNCNKVAYCTCATLTTGFVFLIGYLFYIDYKLSNMFDGGGPLFNIPL